MHDMPPEAAHERIAASGAITIDAHNDRAGYVIEDAEHGLVMLLVDLVGYARKHGIDMDAAMASARETYRDVTA